jgi:hypothetical protein
MAVTNAKSGKKSKRILFIFKESGNVAKIWEFGQNKCKGIHPFFVLLIIAAFFCKSNGQQVISPEGNKGRFERAIEDNSFFIEEAYNQESGVVQHIMNCSFFSAPAPSVEYTFTQEWPIFGQTHQFSYTIPYLGVDGTGGLGDILLNYRYQLLDSDNWVAIAPRLSLILRTGSGPAESGSKTLGWQFDLPMSKRISNGFAAHLNVGVTLEPGFEEVNAGGKSAQRMLATYSVGGSIIWLATQDFNILAEALFSSAGDIGDNGEYVRSTEAIISPSVRYAVTAGSLQIVPGLAVPVKLAGSGSTVGAFLYLSFEHPF